MNRQDPALEVRETEDELISTAQVAVSRCNWVVGECAAKWTKKFARGRTDADFAALVGLSGDQVYQRRRVWEAFGGVQEDYPSLKWSHFYVAVNWDDASDCLGWAEENKATVAEMKAWRRAMRGEDLTAEPPPDDWGGDPSIRFIPSEPEAVRDPSEFGSETARRTDRSGETREASETVAGVSRESEASGSGYAPFRRDAGSPAPQAESSVGVAERPAPSPEQVLKKITRTLERADKTLTAEIVEQCRAVSDEVRQPFVEAVRKLQSKADLLE